MERGALSSRLSGGSRLSGARIRAALRRPGVWAGLAVAAFVLALVLWTDGLGLYGPGSASTATSPGAAGAVSPSGGSAHGGTGAATPTPAGQAATGALVPTLGALPGSSGTVGTEPGTHRLVITISSSGRIGALGYVVRGQGKGTARYDVPSPFVRSFTVDRASYVAAVTVQVAADQLWASCLITVDGHTASHYTAKGPYQVVTCIA